MFRASFRRIALAAALIGCGQEPPPATPIAEPADRPPAPARERELPPLPPSLANKSVPGELHLDAAGRFVATPGALRLFDHYLSARNVEGEGVARARIWNEIDTRLEGQAADDAYELFGSYLAYLDRARSLEPTGSSEGELAIRFDQMKRLRRNLFGDAAERLFAEEEQLARVAIERRRILDDPDLSDRDKISRLAELQAGLPDELREAEEREHAPLRPDDEAVEDPPEAEVPVEPAADGASWAERMQAYRVERDEVLHNVRFADDEQRAYFLNTVRERHFEPDELPRVEALDRIEMRDRAAGLPPP